MNGWEFLEALRQQPSASLARTPVAVVSAAADIVDIERDYGCSVLKKPVNLERLFALAHAHAHAHCDLC